MVILPIELWENILVFYGCGADGGPPRSLRPLRPVCRLFRNIVDTSNALPARIYRQKFSTGRTAGLDDLTAAEWREQLEHVGRALAYVQKRWGLDGRGHGSDEDEVLLEDVLWTVFIMCHDDDDGSNKRQLDNVDAYSWLRELVLGHLYDESESGWPADSVANSLILWSFWFMTTKERILAEPGETSERIVSLLFPYIVAQFRYPTAYAPANHYYLPLPTSVVLSNRRLSSTHFLSVPTAHGPFPKYRQLHQTWNIPVYGRRLALSAPLITTAARLLYFIRRECFAMMPPTDLPRTRAEAQPGLITPTQEDIREWQLNSLGGPTGRGGGTKIGCSLARAEWARIRHCHNAWHGFSNPHIYQPGTLTGLFAGRMMMPNEPALAHVLQLPTLDSSVSELSLGMFTVPLYMRLQEFVCPYGGDVLPCTTRGPPTMPMDIDEDSDVEDELTSTESAELNDTLQATFDDGVFNAYLPEHTTRDSSDGVHISTPNRTYHYRRLPIPHDTETCDGCVKRAEEEAQISLDGQLENDSHHRERLLPCTGVRDVYIRGHTDMRHSMAWHPYRFYGRVRQWDGLITIIRTGSDGGKLLLYGYLTNDGTTIVGNWRLAAGDVGMPGWEGPFSMSMVDESSSPLHVGR